MALAASKLSVVAQILALFASVESAHAACLVLKGGASMELRTIPKAKGGLVVFEDPNGRLMSMRGSEVDMAATEDANQRGVCGGSIGTPVRDTSRPITIQAPTDSGVHSPTASEILARRPVTASGEKAGPPRGWSIDCSTVECGKSHDSGAVPLAGGPILARSAVPVPGPDAESSTGPAASDGSSALASSSPTRFKKDRDKDKAKDDDKHVKAEPYHPPRQPRPERIKKPPLG